MQFSLISLDKARWTSGEYTFIKLKCGDFIMEKCQKLFILFIRILHSFFGGEPGEKLTANTILSDVTHFV